MFKSKKYSGKRIELNETVRSDEPWYSQARTDMVFEELEQMTDRYLRNNQSAIDYYQELARSM